MIKSPSKAGARKQGGNSRKNKKLQSNTSNRPKLVYVDNRRMYVNTRTYNAQKKGSQKWEKQHY